MARLSLLPLYARWFDFAIADELHQLAGDTAQGNGLGVLERAARKLIALTAADGGYATISSHLLPHGAAPMARKVFRYGGRAA